MIEIIRGNFRGMRKGWLITVLEGEGTKEDPAREQIYVYNERGEQVGIINGWEQWSETNKKESK